MNREPVHERAVQCMNRHYSPTGQRIGNTAYATFLFYSLADNEGLSPVATITLLLFKYLSIQSLLPAFFLLLVSFVGCQAR
jgi:hypothetical protein